MNNKSVNLKLYPNYIGFCLRFQYAVLSIAYNKYDEIFEKAHKYVTIKSRIDNINKSLIDEISKDNVIEKIRKVEEIVYEGRKI